METGIRELKDNLSRYIRRIEAGERIAVTAHGTRAEATLVLRYVESSALVAALLERDGAARAGRPFPVEPIRTLDAVHLATAEQLGEPPALVTIVTRDERVKDNAVALGYAVE
jgi:predicted nucleic acid-binding protein